MSELHIDLTKPNTHIYYPGDTVSGAVLFIPAFNARLRAMIVSLKGCCYTSSLGANTKVAHHVPFLHLSSSTLQESYTYQGDQYEAPFSFVFPESTEVDHIAGPQNLRSLFNQGPQGLPDSFVISTRNCMQAIRYCVHVEVHGRRRAECEETVLFRQPFGKLNEDIERMEQEVEDERRAEERKHGHDRHAGVSNVSLGSSWRSDKSMRYRLPSTIGDSDGQPRLSLHALPMVSAHHKSAMQRYKYAKAHHKSTAMTMLFKPWKIPRIIFMPSIYCPTRIAVGQEIPLILAVDCLKNPMWAGLGIDEPLVLEGFSLAVTAHTRTIMQNRPTKRRWGRCLELSYAVLQATGLSHPIDIDGVPTPLVQNFKILPGTIPSFSTYTISRGYSIDVYFKFRFDGEVLGWGASMNLTITSDDAITPAAGENMDPLLFTDPRLEPQYFWRSRIEAGAAESTGRTDVFPDRAGDDVGNMAGLQTGHGRLPRTSYAFASALVVPGLMVPMGTATVQMQKGSKAVVGMVMGISGRPYRRYLKDVEKLVQPLYTFKHGLGFDGGESDSPDDVAAIGIDGCGIIKSCG